MNRSKAARATPTRTATIIIIVSDGVCFKFLHYEHVAIRAFSEDGSFYSSNADGSKYYESPRGHASYTPPSSDTKK